MLIRTKKYGYLTACVLFFHHTSDDNNNAILLQNLEQKKQDKRSNQRVQELSDVFDFCSLCFYSLENIKYDSGNFDGELIIL